MDENLDERAIHELEEVLDTKIYPGTEIMRDVGSHHFVKTGGGEQSVLVPQPSDDPHDPLNWSPFWKAMAIFTSTCVSFTLNLGPLALAPMFEYYAKEWDRSLADVVQFTGVAILVLGFSNFIWVPVMVTFGRRPVAIFSTLICLCTSIWRARATSYNSFMGACILNGLAAGPCETLQPQVIADVIFLHDRGKHQTLYFSMYFISLMVGPIIAGAMATNTGWRSFWWFYTALVFFAFAVNVLFFPETRYERAAAPPASTDPAASGEKVEEKTTANDSSEERKMEATGAAENDGPATTDAAAAQNSDGGDKIVGQTATGDGNGEKLHAQLTHEDPWLGRGRPGKWQWRLFQPYRGSMLKEFWLPIYLHAFPVVEWAAFVCSWSASGFLVVNLSQTQAFAAPPYNYSSQTIGLFNLAVLVGGVIGLLTCGPLSDWVAAYLTRRNNGVREPEMRLVAMIPYVLIMIVGSVCTSVGYDSQWPWQPTVIVGYTFLGIQVSALPSIASTYAIDSYKPVTGSLFVAISVNKNVWGYGVSKFITPWATASGFKAPILTNMALITVFSAFGIVFWFRGKKMRGWTRNSFVHKLRV